LYANLHTTIWIDCFLGRFSRLRRTHPYCRGCAGVYNQRVAQKPTLGTKIAIGSWKMKS
jgi:hypothetical protein